MMAKPEMKKDREAKGIFKDTAKSDTIKRVLKHIGAYRRKDSGDTGF